MSPAFRISALRRIPAAHVETGLFVLLLVLHLLPLWTVRYFMTADGPAHLYNAWVTKVLLAQPRHPWHQTFAFNPVPVPNYLTRVLLVGSLQVLPAWLAEKLVQTLYVLGLPLALRYLVRAWQPRAGFLALLAFPLVYSAVFQYGFYNFCLSLILLLLGLGYWKRHLAAQPLAARPVAGLAGLLLLLYFAHPLSYLVAGFVLGLLVLEQAALPGTSPNRLQRLRTGLAGLLLASSPSLLLLGWYLREPTAENQVDAISAGPGQLLQDWLALEPLRFMGSAEATYRLLLAAVLLGLVAYAGWCHGRGRGLTRVWAFTGAAVLLVLAYLWLPDALLGGSILRPRLGLLSYLLLLGLLATVPYPPRLRQAIMVATVVLAVLLLTFRWGKYRTLATGVEEYQTAAAYLRPGASLVAFTYAPVSRMPNGKDYQSYIDVFSHASSYLSVEKELLNLENYEAYTGYFPLVWQPGQARLTERTQSPARFEWPVTPRAQWPEYVLLWGRTQAPAPTGNARQLATHLARHYRLVYRSPTQYLELYTRSGAQVVSASARQSQ